MESKPIISGRVVLALAITIVTWGTAFAAIRVALAAFGPGEMALLRLSFASIALAIYAIFTRMRLPAMGDLPGILWLGLIGYSLYYAALNFGERTVPSGIASLLIATSPIFTALMATIFLNERLSLRGWIGVFIAFSGVALIVVGQQGNFSVSWDAIYILLAAISAAGLFVCQRPFLSKYSALELTTFSIWAGTLFMLVFAPSLMKQCHAASWRMIMAVAYLGLFPAALGYVLWNYAMSKLPVSRVSSFLYLVPVIGMSVGWITLNETPAFLSLCGAPVIVAGVYLVNARMRDLNSTLLPAVDSSDS